MDPSAFLAADIDRQLRDYDQPALNVSYGIGVATVDQERAPIVARSFENGYMRYSHNTCACGKRIDARATLCRTCEQQRRRGA